MSGRSRKARKKLLGHANIQVTEQYLKGFDQEALNEKVRRLF